MLIVKYGKLCLPRNKGGVISHTGNTNLIIDNYQSIVDNNPTIPRSEEE
nr:MAG TPA: hypothetical protein [Crassvirales sp.]